MEDLQKQFYDAIIFLPILSPFDQWLWSSLALDSWDRICSVSYIGTTLGRKTGIYLKLFIYYIVGLGATRAGWTVLLLGTEGIKSFLPAEFWPLKVSFYSLCSTEGKHKATLIPSSALSTGRLKFQAAKQLTKKMIIKTLRVTMECSGRQKRRNKKISLYLILIP